jgi:hypothetical protein
MEVDLQFQLICEFSLHRPIAFFNTTLNVGEVSINGTAMKGLAGAKFRFNMPFPDGDSLPAAMTVFVGSLQVAEITYKVQALGQSCSLEYGGKLYQFIFQNTKIIL